MTYLSEPLESRAKLLERLVNKELDLDKALQALTPLIAIAAAYRGNELDDEFWGPNLEHQNDSPGGESF